MDTVRELGEHVRVPEVPAFFTNSKNETVFAADLLSCEGFPGRHAWDILRDKVKSGMRNSLCMAIAPTATISNIAGCTQSIEPSYKNLFVKTNLGGDYTVINEHLIADLKSMNLWNAQLARELKRADGSIQNFDLPHDLKELYQTAFDIEPEQLIRCAAARQVYIDQAQSLNLYLGAPSGRRLDEMYRYAWHSGLKTTYYLRTKAATGVEKSSINAAGGSSLAGTGGKACSIENPDCESCQ
jgi:ribonucleoside-diphosphate reductase alpha chain